jgi:hypothetical protein
LKTMTSNFGKRSGSSSGLRPGTKEWDGGKMISAVEINVLVHQR